MQKRSFIALALRLTLFALLLAVAQVLAYALAPNRAVPSAVQQAERVTRDGVDILYVGDSTLYRGAPDETDTRTLPERVAESLPGVSLEVIAHDAYSPVLYAEFARFLGRQPRPPKLLIVPLNLRSFSVERDRRPEYQFRREIYFLRHESAIARAAFQPLASWGVVELQPIGEEDFQHTPVRDGDVDLGTIAELSPAPGESLNDANTADFIELCYRFTLSPEDRQIRALGEMVKILHAAPIPAVFYITPIDLELGAELHGDGFRDWIAANASFLESFLHERGATVLNLATNYRHDTFVLDHFPDAYLRAHGKQAVAEHIATAAQTLLD